LPNATQAFLSRDFIDWSFLTLAI